MSDLGSIIQLALIRAYAEGVIQARIEHLTNESRSRWISNRTRNGLWSDITAYKTDIWNVHNLWDFDQVLQYLVGEFGLKEEDIRESLNRSSTS